MDARSADLLVLQVRKLPRRKRRRWQHQPVYLEQENSLSERALII